MPEGRLSVEADDRLLQDIIRGEAQEALDYVSGKVLSPAILTTLRHIRGERRLQAPDSKRWIHLTLWIKEEFRMRSCRVLWIRSCSAHHAWSTIHVDVVPAHANDAVEQRRRRGFRL